MHTHTLTRFRDQNTGKIFLFVHQNTEYRIVFCYATRTPYGAMWEITQLRLSYEKKKQQNI